MEIAAKLDEMGKGAWIAVMIAAFVVFWPAGLALAGLHDMERKNGLQALLLGREHEERISRSAARKCARNGGNRREEWKSP